MIPPLFFCELVLVVLVWLFLMLYWLGPNDPTGSGKAILSPALLRPKRSREPKPFVGLTHQPPCALCKQEAASPKAPSPSPPAPMPSTHRRPRTVDTSLPFYPHRDCDYCGWLELGNLRATGHPSGGPWRQFQCLSCNGYFLETHGTLFHGKWVVVELIVRVRACVATTSSLVRGGG
jgi:hypothetical protein